MNEILFSRRRLCTGMVVLALGANIHAQGYPTKPIRIVVPFPAGGGTDSMTRSLGEGLTKDLGQPVIVDNKPGAGTVIGNDVVAKSAPDGHTLLLSTSAVAIVPSLFAKLPYDADSALRPIMMLGRAPNVAVVRAESPLRTARDFISQARAHPGKLTYGSAGNGTSTHLAAELLKISTKTFVTHVPYRGAAPMVTDLLAGQIDIGFGTLPSLAPFLASGKLRALAITSSARSALLPDTPTFAESGVPGYEADVWYGIFAPAGTPPTVIEQLHAAFKRASATKRFRKSAASEGLVLSLDAPAATVAFYRAEVQKWRQVVKAQSIRMD